MRYDEMVELARICANNARIAGTDEVARVLWKMAREYQDKAAKLDHGNLPDIGQPPPRLMEYAASVGGLFQF